jgi:HAD superfamily hydrolase (TIGR01490 family)
MTKAAAFFDLDRTLMSGASAYYFGKAAYREGMLPLPRLLADGLRALSFRMFGASDEQSEALRDRILASVAGQPAEDMRRLAPTVIEEILPRIRPEAEALLEMHEQAGRDVYIISASPVEIVEELARALDITGGLGTESEIVDGVYTGRLAAPFCYGEGKAERMRQLAVEHGYDLTASYAYSDSASDLPMMQVV